MTEYQLKQRYREAAKDCWNDVDCEVDMKGDVCLADDGAWVPAHVWIALTDLEEGPLNHG